MVYALEAVSVEATHPLRLAVLRPGRTLAEVALPKDTAADALHVVARVAGGEVVATGSIHREDRAHHADERVGPGFRIRGMATAPEHRGRGLGMRVLERLVDHARAHQAAEVWCNARTGALTLYERAGFRTHSAIFEIDDIGPHVVMVRSLATDQKL